MYSVCRSINIHCTVYIVHCTVYSVQWTLYSEQCSLYGVQCTLYTVHCVSHYVFHHTTCNAMCIYSTLRTLYVHGVQCTYSVRLTPRTVYVHDVQCTYTQFSVCRTEYVEYATYIVRIVYDVQCTYSIWRTMYVQCTTYSVNRLCSLTFDLYALEFQEMVQSCVVAHGVGGRSGDLCLNSDWPCSTSRQLEEFFEDLLSEQYDQSVIVNCI